jgi:RimJ/RimL family protein N-acetyltransferase
MAIHLETPRFHLDSLTRLEAARHTFKFSGSPEYVWSMGLGRERSYTFYKWYKQLRKYNERKKLCFGIRPKGSNDVIGVEMAELTASGVATLTVGIGDRAWWGKGVVQETRSAVLDYLFQRTNCRRAWGTPSVRNFPSVFNYQALGFTSEGILRSHGLDWQSGEQVDHVIFAMLKDDWIARRAQQAKGTP